MKKITLSLVMITMALIVIAQTPQALKYQAVARDNTGNVLTTTNVTFRISILQGSAGGTSVCTETYDATTNEFGLVNLEIGTGEPETGSFTGIDWGNGPYYLQVEMDENGGESYQLMGTSQLLSVPFALYADSSGNTGATQINDLTDAKTAGNNLYLGLDAGVNDDSTNNQNVGVGRVALNANTSGHHNTATGYYALFSNITGNYNTAYGYNASFNNTTGNYNTVYGNAANLFNEEGSNNTMIGYQAGRGTIEHNKSGNVFLGYRAGYNDTTDNKLYIENSGSSTPLIYGDFDNDIIRFNAKRVEIRNPDQNIFIGDSTGVMNTGSRNMFIGDKAGYSNTIGSDNIFIGDSTGFSSTTGDYNLFMGNWAGQLSTTGNSNVILGIAAGQANLDGYRNVMVGTTSGWSNTSGYENTFLGTSAGGYNTTGSCNTYIGRRAGLNNQEGDSSIFIGYYAGAQETTSHKLYIDNSDTIDPLIYGEFDNDLVRINGDMDVTGSFLNFGIDDLLDGKTEGNSVFLGWGAGASDNGTYNYNTAVGYNAFNSNTSGRFNVAVGYKALIENTTGEKNLAIGFNALLNCDTGSYNCAVGNSTLVHTNNKYNTAIGNGALMYNNLGTSNTGCGYYAGRYNNNGSYNTFIGYQAGCGSGYHDKSGNVFLGYQAGYYEYGDNKLYIENSNSSTPLIYGEFDNDILAFNAKVGIGTMDPGAKLEVRGSVPDDGPIFKIGNSDGSHSLSLFPGRENDPNPFIQWKEGDPLRFSTDEGGWSEKMRITSDGNVGIGTSLPLGRLDVRGKVKVSNSLDPYAAMEIEHIIDDDGHNCGLRVIHENSYQGEISSNMAIYGLASQMSDGTGDYFAGIYGWAQGGYTCPAYGVVGSNSLYPPGGVKYAVYAVGDLAYSGDLISVSDAKLKENKKELNNILPKLMSLRAKSYTHSQNKEYQHMHMAQGIHYGLIAQELEAIFPELVKDAICPGSPDENTPGENIEYKGVKYMEMIPLLLQGMQEQQQMIEELISENQKIKEKIRKLEQ